MTLTVFALLVAFADPAEYLTARQAARRQFVLAGNEAAEVLRGKNPPVVIDLRPAENAGGSEIANARRTKLAELFAPGSLEALPKDAPILVVDDGSAEAVEAMVLLRMAGYQAHALRGGAIALPGRAAAESSGAGAGTNAAREANAATPPAPAVPPPPPQVTWRDLPPGFLWSGAALLAACIGMLAWFFVVQPRLRARPLHQAVRLLRTGEDGVLQEAETLLSRASAAGLRARDLKTVRFLLALVRARLGRHDEAVTTLGERLALGDLTADVLYLDLWLKVKTKKWEDAESRWYQSGEVLQPYLDSSELAGIAFLEVGRQCLARREYDRALASFDKVRQLGVHADRIPGHLGNLELVLALGALFEKNDALARQRFQAILDKAEVEGKSTLLPRIGLLLCQWRSDAEPDVDAPLTALLAEAEESGEDASILPPLTLWHSVSLLFRWLFLPKLKGLPPEARAELDARLARVRERMPEDGDADLIAGLIDYFCAPDDSRRRDAVELLRKAIAAGVTLPEVLYLVQVEDRRAEQEKNKVDVYFRIVRSFLEDQTVPIELRQELYEYLHRFAIFQMRDDVAVPTSDNAVVPSLHDVAAACEVIENRVRGLFRNDAKSENDEIRNLLHSLTGSRDTLHKTVEELGKIEQKLMRTAGEALLPDEAPAIVSATAAPGA